VSLSEEIQKECGGLVTRWVVVAEVAEAVDSRELHVMTGAGFDDEGPPSWDVVGMLRVAQTMIEQEED
jgi:hypothetical protein